MGIKANIPFLQARHYKAVNRTKVGLIVIHTAEIGEVLDGAEILMQRCAQKRVRADGKEIVSSWHFAVDANSITQSVREEDIAYHAPGANADGIGIELCGRARQTPAEWDDDFSRKTLVLAAQLTAYLCQRWKVPIEFVDRKGLVAGLSGITTHAEVSMAFRKSTHTDPGPAWPRDRFIDLVRAATRPVA